MPPVAFTVPSRRRPMSSELAIVLLLLCAAIAMFAINKPRMDAVALIILTVLPFTGAAWLLAKSRKFLLAPPARDRSRNGI